MMTVAVDLSFLEPLEEAAKKATTASRLLFCKKLILSLRPKIEAAISKVVAERDALRTEVEIVSTLPVPVSKETNTLGWLKARALAALNLSQEKRT